MPKPKNAMDIFQHLDQSNCRECGEKTCLAFAGAVFLGKKKLEDCPKLDAGVIEKLQTDSEDEKTVEDNRVEHLSRLKAEAASLDLAEAAERTGGRFDGRKLTLKILGKDFSVGVDGNLYADIHVNPWVAVPFLNYVIHGEGISPSGNWVSFRELKNGKERYPLFQKRCEESMKRIADGYTSFFDDMVHIFGGKETEKHFEADISVVLHPLPRVPLMICYQRPEDGMESVLTLYFDETADKNLDIGSIFTLGAGLTQMFEKLSQRHGVFETAAAG